jgi:hypothetical protein
MLLEKYPVMAAIEKYGATILSGPDAAPFSSFLSKKLSRQSIESRATGIDQY